MKKQYYSNGKLLLTGEYLVLDGARALAIPTRFGQFLTVEESSDGEIHWKSFDHDGSLWFQSSFTCEEIKSAHETSDVGSTLSKILNEAFAMSGKRLGGFNIETHLTFPRNWGLGSSSTLINNIAQWLDVDAFELLQKSFGGSGYDIAAAQNNTPVFYELENGKPIVEPVSFSPVFSDKIYFVYLNRKQSSKSAIANYRKKDPQAIRTLTSIISQISSNIVSTTSDAEFRQLLKTHETIIGAVLQMPTIGEELFPDFDGMVKSLGGWGGDFIMAVSDRDPAAYFKLKGFETIIPFNEMILK